MTSFEFLTVALSFVSGLAVTLLLTSLLAAFRARGRTRMSWVPLTWVGYVLVMQFDVWWETYSLSAMEHWTVGAFALLLLMTMLLFAAGGLVLPSGMDEYPSDLGDYFRRDGRWGVGMVAVLFLVGSIANVTLFDLGTFGAANIFNLLGIAIITVVVGAKRRAIHGSATILFGVWLAAYLWTFVPRVY